jgi:glycosyltransferase involved in cell wall biosynthesis
MSNADSSPAVMKAGGLSTCGASDHGLVSIVIPCYRGERYLRQAIESCLRQTYVPIEVIVVDDASPDSCLAISRSFAQGDSRISVVQRLQNGGVSRAFNDGIAAANGEFLTRLAQDDILEPFAIERMAETLRSASPGTGLVYCDTTFIDEVGNQLGTRKTPPPEYALRYGNRMGLCVMWTRDVWQTIGGFDPNFDASEDYEYWLRVTARFGFVKSEGPPALRVRQHSAMGSVIFADKQVINLVRAIKAAYGSRFGFGRKWPQRQIALALARLTAAYNFVDRRSYGNAIVQVGLSFCEWPLPFPAGVWMYDRRWKRPRMLASLALKFARSQLIGASSRRVAKKNVERATPASAERRIDDNRLPESAPDRDDPPGRDLASS